MPSKKRLCDIKKKDMDKIADKCARIEDFMFRSPSAEISERGDQGIISQTQDKEELPTVTDRSNKESDTDQQDADVLNSCQNTTSPTEEPLSISADEAEPMNVIHDFIEDDVQSTPEYSESSDTSGNNSKSKQRISGFAASWKEEFLWVEPYTSSEDKVIGMMCKLCRRHCCRPPTAAVGKAIWVDKPCLTLTRAALLKHSKCKSHDLATSRDKARALSDRIGTVVDGMQPVMSARLKALEGKMRNLYFLVKQGISHTTNFKALEDHMISLGLSYLKDAYCGENAKYVSHRFIDELLESLAWVIHHDQLEKIKSGDFSLLFDETTDVSVKKQLTIYGRFIDKNQNNTPVLTTQFLTMVELPDGTADSVHKAIVNFLDEKEVNYLQHLHATGSDGASVMVGRKNGVNAKFKETIPHLLSIHCANHRLALACGQASKEVNLVQKFNLVLLKLYEFYENSSVRAAGLERIQTVLDDPQLKLLRAVETRWLSHEHAVSNLRRCLKSVIASLDREVSERVNAKASGLLSFVLKYDFIACLYMCSDILPPLAILSKALQRPDRDFSTVKPLVNATKSTLTALRNNPGEHFSSLEDVISDLKQDFRITHATETANEKFMKEAYQPYFDAIIKQLDERFPDLDILEHYGCFDVSLWPVDDEDGSYLMNYKNDSVKTLAAHFPWAVTEDALVEFRSLKQTIMAGSERPTASQLMLKLQQDDLKNLFPNISRIALVGLLVPASTADCERGFSRLSKIKTDARNRLVKKTLNNLLLISLEGPSPEQYDFGRAIAKWKVGRYRRLFDN